MTHPTQPVIPGPVTPPVKNSNIIKIILITFISVVFFIAIVISWVMYKSSNDDIIDDKELTTPSKYVRPNEYTEYYTLKIGDDPIRVHSPNGYECNYSGGGKKYYIKPQNNPKILVGGDIESSVIKRISYADLSAYDEEITLACKFKKMK